MRHVRAMKIPRPVLHVARIADEILFYPVLAFVVWGELTGTEPQLPGLFGEIQDKALHFIAYFILAAMAAAACKSRRPAVLAAIGLILLGAVLEIAQGYTGRDMSLLDEAANAAGAVAGGIAARAGIEPLRRRLGYW